MKKSRKVILISIFTVTLIWSSTGCASGSKNAEANNKPAEEQSGNMSSPILK